jgi:hypothetical protein
MRRASALVVQRCLLTAASAEPFEKCLLVPQTKRTAAHLRQHQHLCAYGLATAQQLHDLVKLLLLLCNPVVIWLTKGNWCVCVVHGKAALKPARSRHQQAFFGLVLTAARLLPPTKSAIQAKRQHVLFG